MESRKRKELRSQAQSLSTTIHVSGELSEGVVNEQILQLKKRKLVKVKLLKEGAERGARDELAKELATLTGSEAVEVRGKTVVLYRERGG